MPHLTLAFIGPPVIEQDGVPLQVDTRKAIALLAYLAVTQKEHGRDSLAALLWTGNTPSRARGALRRTLSVLGKSLVGDGLLLAEDRVSFYPGADCWFDVKLFQDHLRASRSHHCPDVTTCQTCLNHLQAAVDLYRDDFLAGLHLRDCAGFDDWRFLEEETLRRQCADALGVLVSAYQNQGNQAQAITCARRWLTLDPLREEGHRQLIQLYFQAGDYAAALRQYDKCTALLAEQLGLEPHEETLALYKHILREKVQGVRPTAVGATNLDPKDQAPATSAFLPHNLPTPLTSFVGRSVELAELLAYFNTSSSRLLTILGPGGVGKTRLAIQAGQQLLAAPTDQIQHGIYFVPLVAIHSADALVAAIAASLNYSFYGREEPGQQLQRYLKHKRLLLIMDNFEHLIDQAELLLEILQKAPHVRFLVTSRACLNFQAESLLELQGLSYPVTITTQPAYASPRPPADENSEAVQLFVHRARQIRLSFSPTTTDMAAIGQACHLLEGNPLAIELAATLTRSFSCADIVTKITTSLDALTTSMRDITDRHINLRTVFMHSWQMLTPAEQGVFAQLAIFPGSFDQPAAAEIAGATPAMLTRLVDHSLLAEKPGPRYEWHEILRQYALEKLQAGAAAWQTAQANHGRYFAHFLQEREALLRGGHQKSTLVEVNQEIDNIRTAWNWALAEGQTEMLRQSLTGLTAFYDAYGLLYEGNDVFTQALVQHRQRATTPAQEELLALLLNCSGRFMTRLGQYDEASGRLQECLELCRRRSLLSEMALCLNYLGQVAFSQGKHEQAWHYLQESLALSQEIGNLASEATALSNLGNLACEEGKYEEANQFLQRSLVIQQKIDRQRGVGICLNNLGNVALAQGSLKEARRFFGKSLEIKREIGLPHDIAVTLMNSGLVALQLGHTEEARQCFQESLLTFTEIGQTLGTLYALLNLGNVAGAQQNITEAQNFYENALGMGREAGIKRGIVLALTYLGEVAYILGAYQEARQRYDEALALAHEAHIPRLALGALVGIATLRHQAGDAAQAAELLLFSLQHPAIDHETQEEARQALAQITPHLAPATLAALEAQASTWRLDDLIHSLSPAG